MTEHGVSLDMLIEARKLLITEVRAGLNDAHREFLLSIYRRQPDWSLLPLEGLERLPAVKWRELNLDRAGNQTQKAIVKQLDKVLSK